jgi:hypothetical protein
MLSEKTVSDVHQYLEELDKKIEKLKETSADTPRIGIFWLHLKDGKIQIFFSDILTLDFG